MGGFSIRGSVSLLAVAIAASSQGDVAFAQEQAPVESGEGQPPVIDPADLQVPAEEVTRTIVVTGTRIQTPNRTSASPVESVRPEDFTLTGVPNVEQTLNQMPQLVPGFTNTSNNPGTGAATLDLRGLGSVRTLILVNGRRWIASDAGQIPEVDVNTIPSALIERVDIVTGGASAVYGSDAVTGVINFVLKNRLQGLHVEARSNITERGDGQSLSADASYGTSFLDGRGNLIASVGWLDQSPLLQAERDFSSSTFSDGCVLRGTRDDLGASLPVIPPPFVCEGPDREWGLLRQGSFNVPQGFIPGPFFFPTGPGLPPQFAPFVQFTPGGSIAPFFPPTDSYNFAPLNYLQVPLQRLSGNLLGSLEISDRVEPYVELSFIRTRSPQQLAPAGAILGSGSDTVEAVRINLDNPFLSDQARELLQFNFGPATDGIIELDRPFLSRLTGLGPRRVENERLAYRGLGGVRGQISSRWSYDVFYSHSYVAHDTEFLNSASARRLQQAMLARSDPATGEIVCIDPTGGCVPINIFGQQDISPAAAQFLRIDPVEKTRVEEQVAEASVRGDLGELPGGTVSAVLGSTWRKSSYTFTPDLSFEEGDTVGFLASTGASGSTQVFELFGETLLPILADRPWATDLSAELGLRYSDYDSVGGVWTWKAMAEWAPIRAVRLRGGVQRAVRAPNVRELHEESTAQFGFVTDPCNPVTGIVLTPELLAACMSNGAAITPNQGGAVVHTGGSEDLKAETARTTTLGVALQPLRGVNATVDFYDINIRDAIGVFGGGVDFVVVGCIFGGADPADPLCQAFERGPNGIVSQVFLPTANLARLKTRGIDWQLNGAFRLLGGSGQLAFSGTRLIGSEVKVNPNIDPIRCAGSFGFPCGNTIQGVATPKWKLYNRLNWTRGPATLSVRHRYFSPTRDARFAVNEALDQPPPEFVPVNAVKMQARHYFDLATTINVAPKFQLTIGVNNVTDAKPSLVGIQQVQANTDPSLYDVLGRRFFVTVAARPF